MIDNLRQHYDLAEEIVIVEGAVPQAIKNGLAGPDGLSNDGMENQIQWFIENEDHEKKVKFIRAGEKLNRNRLRQECLNNCTMDWVLIIDADEFYKTEDFGKIRDGIDEADWLGLEMCYYPFMSMADWEMGDQWDPMERLFKRTEELRYPDLDGGQYVCKDGGSMWILKHKHPIDIKCWHYFRIQKDSERIFTKMKYYMERDAGKIVTDVSELYPHEQSMVTKIGMEEYGFKYIPITDQPAQIQKKFLMLQHENSSSRGN